MTCLLKVNKNVNFQYFKIKISHYCTTYFFQKWHPQTAKHNYCLIIEINKILHPTLPIGMVKDKKFKLTIRSCVEQIKNKLKLKKNHISYP